MSKEFKIGDRVRVAKQSTHYLDKDAVVGDTGTVVVVGTWDDVLVDFDQARKQYNCDWSLKLKNGYWCYVDNLKRIGTDPTAVTEKIIITTDGKTTTARRYKGKELLDSAEAVCSASDPFDFERGAIIAFARLTDCDYKLSDTEEPPKPEPKFKVGDVVRVKGHDYISHCLIRGSIAVIKRVAHSGHPGGGFSCLCEGVGSHGLLKQTVHENDLEKFDIKGE
jgi:hypothetical protein